MRSHSFVLQRFVTGLIAIGTAGCQQSRTASAPATTAAAVAAPTPLTEPRVGLDAMRTYHDASGSHRAVLSTLDFWQAASTDFEHALLQSNAPQRWRTAHQFCQGRIEMIRGNVAAAVTFFRGAATAEPDWPPPHVALADALRHGNDTEGALQEIRRGQTLEANWWVPVAYEASTLASVGRFPESIATYRRALTIAPSESAIFDGLALVQSASGDDAGASASARSAIQHDADSPWAHLVLAEQALAHQDAQTALTEATNASRVLPHATSPEHARADALALLHRDDEARAAYQHALQIGDETHQLGFPEARIAAVRDALAHNRLPPPRFAQAQAHAAGAANANANGTTSIGSLLTDPGLDLGRLGN